MNVSYEKKLVCLLLICIMLQSCSLIVSFPTNEYYRFIDRSKYIYDGRAIIQGEDTTTEMVIDLFTKKERRVTGNVCSGKLYSDYPCMEHKGCTIL